MNPWGEILNAKGEYLFRVNWNKNSILIRSFSHGYRSVLNLEARLYCSPQVKSWGLEFTLAPAIH